MFVRRGVVAGLLAVGLVGAMAAPVVAAPAAVPAQRAVVTAPAAPAAGVPVAHQTDLGSYLWGFALQIIANGVVDSGVGVMNSAISAGPSAYFWYQVGRSIFDLGCAWGYEGERLAPPVKPNFSFKCTLAPPWPY